MTGKIIKCTSNVMDYSHIIGEKVSIISMLTNNLYIVLYRDMWYSVNWEDLERI